MLALGEMCVESMGAVEKGLEVLALGEVCLEGMRAVAKGVSRVCAG